MNIKNLFIERDTNSHQAKIPTKSGKLYLSIVAGEHLYSTPRELVKDGSYSQVEIAIFNLETNNWASYNEVKPIFPIIGEGEYRNEDYDDLAINPDNPQNAVFGYIDVNQIKKCLEVL